MSVIKNISQLPDTKQGFTENLNNLTIIGGVFVCEKDFTIPIADINDIESWYDAMQANQFTPLHGVKEFEPQDREMGVAESKHDFTYETDKGQYRHKLKYNWAVDYHKLVQELNGTDKRIIYWDLNWNIYATTDDNVNFRGFKTNRLLLEKLLFSIGSTPAFSTLDIELTDSDELNLRPVIQRVTFNPEDIDRLFINIKVEYVDSDNINFSATYGGENLIDISSSDVTVNDSYTGNLTFTLFNYSGGVYKLSGFSDNVISGSLIIKSTLYIGCVPYQVKIVVEITNNAIFGDGNNEVWGDGNNAVFTA